MRKIFQYILMTVVVVVTASCSNEMDEPMQPAHNGTLQFVVSDFPAFGEDPETRASQNGIPDEGKTAWEEGDELLVSITFDSGKKEAISLEYKAGEWTPNGKLVARSTITEAIAVYAPDCEIGQDGSIRLKEGKRYGLEEYSPAKATVEGNTITVTFDNVERTYSRLRMAGVAEQIYTVTTTGFTPAGVTSEATEAYTLTVDDKGNAYIYGTFAKDATVTVKKGDVTLAGCTFSDEDFFSSGTESGMSYALDVVPNINLFSYDEGATVDITGDSRIIGDGNEYNRTLNIAADATVIFSVDRSASGVKLVGSINVADGKTLTLLVKGGVEHIVDGISLGNGSNVIIEGDLTQENNKLTVTASGGNAGIGANGGVTAGDITIRNARVDATGSGTKSEPYVSGAGIGTANASMGNILIEGSTITAAGGYYDEYSHAASIGMGSHGGTMGNITLKNSKITASNKGDGLASVIGAGSYKSDSEETTTVGSLGDIVVTNTELNLSMTKTFNDYTAIIGPGIGYEFSYVNMGKIVFTDVTQTQLDEMITSWLPSDFYYVYALGRGYYGSYYQQETFGGVWVSDGNGGTVQIGNAGGYYYQE